MLRSNGCCSEKGEAAEQTAGRAQACCDTLEQAIGNPPGRSVRSLCSGEFGCLVTDITLPFYFYPFRAAGRFSGAFFLLRPWKKPLNFVYGVVCFSQSYCSSSQYIHPSIKLGERGKKRLDSFPAPPNSPILCWNPLDRA